MRFSRKIALAVIFTGLLFLVVACKDAQVRGNYLNPYTPEQISRMMSYHGALVAKFDGRQWWFLSGSRWIRLDNANALNFAQAASRNHKDHPIL